MLKEIEQRLRSTPPILHVVPGSTPIPSFGDAERAEVATLGINPSKREFMDGGQLLRGSAARFRNLPDLGVGSLNEAPADVIANVYGGCQEYFQHRPYRRWFGPMEEQLQSVGASYYDGTAAHLDLAHWATDPTWGKLTPGMRKGLLEDGRSFLQWQLGRPHLRLVLLNGRAVLDQFEEWASCRLELVQDVPRQNGHVAHVYRGSFGKVVVIGWSTNLQSSFGVTNVFRRALAASLRRLYRQQSG